MARGRMSGGGRVWRGTLAAVALLVFFATPTSLSAQEPSAGARQTLAEKLALPPNAEQAVQEIYAGEPEAAIAKAQKFEKQRPGDPFGYLLEAEARWWQLFCQQNEIRYGMVDVWNLPKQPENPPYLAAAHKAVKLAEAQLAKDPTARAYLYAGMGYALEARIHGLRGDRMDTAKAGVNAREHLLKAIQLDPQLADADTGLGLYNYYVDTLSPIVKLLRFFLGIPGGSKQQGMRQLRAAMEHATLTAVEARFYLASNLRTYDHNYAEALEVAEPLVRDYPQNPIFLLLVGNLEIELGRREQAAETLGRIGKLKSPDASCKARSERLARELMAVGQGN
jgi:tetratricopeptide (TPR) repeat protein